MLHGLLEAGVVPDAVVGTSVGALNSAFLAGRLDLSAIEPLVSYGPRLVAATFSRWALQVWSQHCTAAAAPYSSPSAYAA
jgi:acyl transferase domain-containing protein